MCVKMMLACGNHRVQRGGRGGAFNMLIALLAPCADHGLSAATPHFYKRRRNYFRRLDCQDNAFGHTSSAERKRARVRDVCSLNSIIDSLSSIVNIGACLSRRAYLDTNLCLCASDCDNPIEENTCCIYGLLLIEIWVFEDGWLQLVFPDGSSFKKCTNILESLGLLLRTLLKIFVHAAQISALIQRTICIDIQIAILHLACISVVSAM